MPAKNSLFQQGGWATQLSCDNPALVTWLKHIEGARQTICSLLGVQCTTHENQCEQVNRRPLRPVLLILQAQCFLNCCNLESDRATHLVLCVVQWTPLAIILTAVAVLLLAVYLLAVLLTSSVEYLRMYAPMCLCMMQRLQNPCLALLSWHVSLCDIAELPYDWPISVQQQQNNRRHRCGTGISTAKVQDTCARPQPARAQALPSGGVQTCPMSITAASWHSTGGCMAIMCERRFHIRWHSY